LVVAPFLEPLEDRVEPPVRVAFELPIDRYIAGIPDLLRQIGRVEDELWLEVGVLFGTREKAEIDTNTDLLQRLIDESGMPGFVAAHVSEELANVWILDALLDLGVENAARELGRQRTHKKIDELLLQVLRQLSKLE